MSCNGLLPVKIKTTTKINEKTTSESAKGPAVCGKITFTVEVQIFLSRGYSQNVLGKKQLVQITSSIL